MAQTSACVAETVNFGRVLPVQAHMAFLARLLGKTEPPKQRIRVCVECGMPVAEHKEWCSILRGQTEMKESKSS